MNAEKLEARILQEFQRELSWTPGVAVRNVAVNATVKVGVALLFGAVGEPSVRRVAEQVAR